MNFLPITNYKGLKDSEIQVHSSFDSLHVIQKYVLNKEGEFLNILNSNPKSFKLNTFNFDLPLLAHFYSIKVDDDDNITPAYFFEVEPGVILEVYHVFMEGKTAYARVWNIAKKFNEAKVFLNSLVENIPTKVKENTFKYLVSYGSSWTFKSADVGSVEFDPDLYNDDFIPFHESIKHWINDWSKKNKSLAILHSAPGTGKTSYLRTLAGMSEHMVYIPPTVASMIGNPEFLGFLMSYPKKVFVIEDAEEILTASETRNPALQNLLNATDGLLGDAINSKFILTFNTSLEKIDPACLRPGRLLASHELKPLTLNKVEKLFKKLGKNNMAKSMTLAEVFNETPLGMK